MNSHYARQRPLAYFQWQYFSSPLPVSTVGAFAGDRLVGHFGLQRKRLSDGRTIDQVADIIIDADYRGEGLFPRLWSAVCQGLGGEGPRMVLANPSGKEACVRKLHFQQVAQLDSLALTAGHLRDVVPEVAEASPRYRLVLDRELLDWRFRRHPLFEYRFFGEEDGSLLVTKMFHHEQVKEGDIVYFQGRPLPDLWRRACLELLAEGATQVNCWALPGTAERSLLLAMGFEATAPQPRFLCVSSDDSSLRQAEHWSIVQCDTEHF